MRHPTEEKGIHQKRTRSRRLRHDRPPRGGFSVPFPYSSRLAGFFRPALVREIASPAGPWPLAHACNDQLRRNQHPTSWLFRPPSPWPAETRSRRRSHVTRGGRRPSPTRDRSNNRRTSQSNSPPVGQPSPKGSRIWLDSVWGSSGGWDKFTNEGASQTRVAGAVDRGVNRPSQVVFQKIAQHPNSPLDLRWQSLLGQRKIEPAADERMAGDVLPRVADDAGWGSAPRGQSRYGSSTDGSLSPRLKSPGPPTGGRCLLMSTSYPATTGQKRRPVSHAHALIFTFVFRSSL